jgi:hypothetical protein
LLTPFLLKRWFVHLQESPCPEGRVDPKTRY